MCHPLVTSSSAFRALVRVSACVFQRQMYSSTEKELIIKAVFVLSVAQYFKLYCVPVQFRKVPVVAQHIPRDCILQVGKINFALRFVT